MRSAYLENHRCVNARADLRLRVEAEAAGLKILFTPQVVDFEVLAFLLAFGSRLRQKSRQIK
jgi:hypothetical protein